MQYLWKLAPAASDEYKERFPELEPAVVQLLYNRGLKTQEQVDEFFHPDYSQDLHDPYLFRDMVKAVNRLYEAIAQKELITVFGDYDADGVCAAAILTTVLEKLGAQVKAYLPHREKEGYGLNPKAVEELSADGTKIVITCDCGISNAPEVELARNKGLEVIITDHHSLPENIPAALA